MQIAFPDRVIIEEMPDRDTDVANATAPMKKGSMASTRVSKQEESSNLPARLLKDKMIGALQRLGYSSCDQEKVASLVDQNVRTVRHNLEHGHNLVYEMDGIQKSLSQLLFCFASFNTNEPLLMITKNDISRLEEHEVEAFVREVLYQLRHEHNIKPVRVAVLDEAAANLATSPALGEFDSVYSLTLLNVVNTEVGGPSMIDLFDDEYCPMQWLQCVAWIEAWQDQIWLWRTQSRDVFGRNKDLVVTNVMRSPEDIQSEVIDFDQVMDDQEVGDNSLNRDGEHEIIGISIEDPAGSEISSLPTHHPAFIELQARDYEKPQIIHPTWKHVNASDNLADLVRLQASQLSSSSSDTDLVAIAADTASAKATSEDGFEMV